MWRRQTESVVLAKETKAAKVKLREVEERGREVGGGERGWEGGRGSINFMV